MKETDKLKQSILKYSPQKYLDLINKAIQYAEKKHAGEKRLSGNDFIIHPLKTAETLALQSCDTNTIISGILTNSFEENDQNKKEINEIFGEEIYNLLLKVEEISKATGANETHYEIVTKYILNSVKDLRPVLVKLAGALHNVETIQYLPEDLQKSKIQKAINIYGKLSEYLYLEKLKKRIEEKAFELQNPIEYRVISEKYADYDLNEDLQKKYEQHIKNLIEKIDPNIKIESRIKSKYSVYNKLKKYEKEWNNPSISKLQDLLGFRIITTSEEKCYKILEVMMDNAELIYKDFEDYISFPKPNNYKAMQGPIIFKEISELQVEIQILTDEMHYTNTYGSASHIAYKASKSRFAKPNADYDWVEQIHKNFESHKSRREEERDIPIDCNIFENEVFVFTPKDQIIDLDKGDTVLDYAFRIHSEVGHSAVAAKKNGKAIPLSYQPQTGDEIDIVTQKGKTCQNESALHIANSSSTRSKILRGLQKKR